MDETTGICVVACASAAVLLCGGFGSKEVVASLATGLLAVLVASHCASSLTVASGRLPTGAPARRAAAMASRPDVDATFSEGDKVPNPRRAPKESEEGPTAETTVADTVDDTVDEASPHRGENNVQEVLDFVVPPDRRTQRRFYRPPDKESVHRRYKDDAFFLHAGSGVPRALSVYSEATRPYDERR